MGFFVKQMVSNMDIAMCDVQMCFVGFSIQIKRAAVAESITLFTSGPFSFHNIVSLVEERTQE